MDLGRYLLKDAHTNKWYLKNTTNANTRGRKTPYEIFLGEKPDETNLNIQGSRVFVRVSEIKEEK